ncbi:RPC7L polymerase, partial [Crypturellus soui]|nr:RPC7L polymerase [Crypturellus soui]
DIERYSDKYQAGSPVDGAIDWSPDWRRLPRELRIRVRRLRAPGECPGRDRTGPAGTRGNAAPIPPLPPQSLEKKEEEVSSEEEEKEEEEEGKEEEEEEYDEEEHEEVRPRRGRPWWPLSPVTHRGPRRQETDYIMSYFDNGEDFGGDSDDNGDEAVY